VKVRRLEIDLTYPDSAAQVLDAAQGWLGLPDVLVNNAAHSTYDGFELLDAATLDAHYTVKCVPLSYEPWSSPDGLNRCAV
jgi:3-oxoacyl-[acyl-carrier protein] reductase